MIRAGNIRASGIRAGNIRAGKAYAAWCACTPEHGHSVHTWWACAGDREEMELVIVVLTCMRVR